MSWLNGVLKLQLFVLFRPHIYLTMFLVYKNDVLVYKDASLYFEKYQ